MALGRVHPQDPHETFCMTVLALKLSRRANAVSSLHGDVCRAHVEAASGRARRETTCRSGTSPTACTSRSWLAPQMRRLYDRHMGPEWAQRSGEPERLGARSTQIDDAELWETHRR